MTISEPSKYGACPPRKRATALFRAGPATIRARNFSTYDKPWQFMANGLDSTTIQTFLDVTGCGAVVAHSSGGRVVAGSNPVIPKKGRESGPFLLQCLACLLTRRSQEINESPHASLSVPRGPQTGSTLFSPPDRLPFGLGPEGLDPAGAGRCEAPHRSF